jgi:nitrite reductase/ring-hydroxylating ferredoxin subunit
MRVTFLFSFAALGGASGYRFNGLPPSSRGGRSSSSRGSRPLNRVISSSAVTLPDLLVGGTPSSTGSTSTRQQREVSRPEQPPAEDGGGRTTSIKARAPPRLEVGRGKNKLPNTWLAVALSSTVKKGKTQKITVNGTPLVIWRDKEGAVHCVSDICIHRGASLASGWVAPSTCVVCPYHGFEFDGEGTLAYMPGVETKRRDSTGVNNASARKTTAYKVTEAGGWVHVFPDAERAGAVEAALEPFAPPEASDPTFRAVEGSMIIDGSVESCMENTLDLLVSALSSVCFYSSTSRRLLME